MVTNINWDQLVANRDKWVAHNFPDMIRSQSVFGVIEELGELAHADLKKAQNIRGSAEEHDEAARDAIGDLTIYLLGVMSHRKVRPNEGFRPMMQQQADTPQMAQLLLASWVGRLAQMEATGKEDSQAALIVSAIVYYAARYCELRNKFDPDKDWFYDVIVEETWEGVSERDWIQWPDTGRPPYPHLKCKAAVDLEGHGPGNCGADIERVEPVGDGADHICVLGHRQYSGK